MMSDPKFKVINAEGNTVSLLMDNSISLPSIQLGFPSVVSSPPTLYSSSYQPQPSSTVLKKHVCKVPNCGRAFTTSGHLARHHRIHTGEKNFPCLLPQCQSKFSRQDNMMQHFRTHFLPKSNSKLRVNHNTIYSPVTSNQYIPTRYYPALPSFPPPPLPPYSTTSSGPYFTSRTSPHHSYDHLK